MNLFVEHYTSKAQYLIDLYTGVRVLLLLPFKVRGGVTRVKGTSIQTNEKQKSHNVTQMFKVFEILEKKIFRCRSQLANKKILKTFIYELLNSG